MLKILIAEDDLHIRTLLSKYLKHHGFEVIETKNGKEALTVFNHEHIDLLITDIMMPEVNGHRLSHRIRETHKSLPILMLTALDTYDEKEKGFLSGVDDYMVKPIDLNEMLLRINALLRRYEISKKKEIVFKHSCLNEENQELKVNGEIINLTGKSFSLLYKLLSYPNKIFTREQLMNQIWGYDSESYDRTVDTHIKKLRESVPMIDFEIITMRGLGYKAVIK
ncbi:response regulator transcription factor [Mycoplasmatota bacterium]|nr:response regulator transcription factor [Mycoplasmatota bacterium]